MHIKNKLRNLITKDIQTKDKVLLSVSAGLTFSFIFLLFGMLYIYMGNYQEFVINITFKTILLAAGTAFFIGWAVLFGITVILPGKIHTIAISMIIGLCIAGYVQGGFLNNTVQLGQLTGDAINWHEHTRYTLVNILVWLLLMFLPVAIRYFFSADIWRKFILCSCILLAGTQAVSLVSLYTSLDDDLHYEPEYYMSREGAYEVSSISNVMVFVIDRLDYSYVEAVREGDPGFFDRLDGFTNFTNAAAVYPATFPAGALMTTGIPYDFDKTRAEYFDYAWRNSEFISALKKNNYIMKYHMDPGYMYTDFSQIIDVADNLKDGRPAPLFSSVIKNFINLSTYSFAPMALKPTFWMPVIKFEVTEEAAGEDNVFANDSFFMQLLQQKGLTVQDKRKNYFYLHLDGSHAPFVMDENGVYTGSSDVISQTKGCFNILYRYMDEMKRLGVYENSTIIILGDHGWEPSGSGYHVGLFIKPNGAADTPLVENNAPVSILDNFIETILESEGISKNATGGISAFNVEENTPGERYVAGYSSTGDEVLFFKITGHITDLSKWEMTDSREFYIDFGTGLPVE